MINRIKSIVDSNRTGIKAAYKTMLSDIEKAKLNYKPDALKSQISSIRAKYDADVQKIRSDSNRSLEYLQKRLTEDDYAGLSRKPKTTVPAELLEEMNLVCATVKDIPLAYIEDFARRAFFENSTIAMQKVTEMGQSVGLDVHFPDANLAQGALDEIFRRAKSHVNRYDPECRSVTDNSRFHEKPVDMIFNDDGTEKKFYSNQLLDLAKDALLLEEEKKNFRIQIQPVDTIHRKPEPKKFYEPSGNDPVVDAWSRAYRSQNYFESYWVDDDADDDAIDWRDAPVNF